MNDRGCGTRPAPVRRVGMRRLLCKPCFEVMFREAIEAVVQSDAVRRLALLLVGVVSASWFASCAPSLV